ncbi:hypothetical protein [Rhodococcus sp. SGAir0479]|uniref:hypothetical protein n=1 Tax=Rhodococcus sp. SGAir0479 TaxID=2567884 RepID=UPI0010CD2B5D|nr:hypothetical protein [Rhodococcus sp. SGAir0479]QCQ92622.1 hypothetical protein E7742_16290 [Rhodococcus sp. SGAir0479]
MSKKSTIARWAGAAAAAAGAVTLALPGIASAEATAPVPAPKISAHVNGDAIDMTVTQTAGSDVFCMPIILGAEDALPLAATPIDQWPGLGDLVDKVYYLGNATTEAGSTVESTTGAADGEINTGLVKPLTPGAYAVVGACFGGDKVVSYNYQVVFFPGGFGSLGQALNLGSATIGMEGGSAVIADLLKSGAGSSMLSANMS